MSQGHEFVEWFKDATGHEPYPFQVRFACGDWLRNAVPVPGQASSSREKGQGHLVDVPTGLGKTAMAVLGWLWRRRSHSDEAIRKATPPRLVYCLPMRVLVEQTVSEAKKWIAELEKHYPNAMKQPPNIHILMGGEEEEDWDIYPECDQIIIGTQDMLLSRALNRGYAAMPPRWPMRFGILNTDCLWVFDEIQLMGAGLATTAQLEAFRRVFPDKDSDAAKNGHNCHSVWMSATLRPEWLKTVDFKDHVDGLARLELNEDDHKNAEVKKRWSAKKPLVKAEAMMGNAAGLAKNVYQARKPGTRTIIIANTVKRARDVFDALDKELNKSSDKATLVLLHSRFRPEDRKKQVKQALAGIQPGEPGTIVVSTQVIEAGVDVSATTLFTELAPWASLVQRFGRCNRHGEANNEASVHWISLPGEEAEAKNVAAPYELDDLKSAQKQLTKLDDVGLKPLQKSLHEIPLPFEHTHVIRRKDLIDLFDTTPDLAGNDIDIDRFIRDVEDSDVRIFWRAWEQPKGYEPPPDDEPAPRHEELCPAPIGSDKNPGFRAFAKKCGGKVWRWSFLDEKWERADAGKIAPGQIFLVHADAGGYSAERGWDPGSKDRVDPIERRQDAGTKPDTPDAIDKDPLSPIGVWQTIAEHTDDLCRAVDSIAKALHLDEQATRALHHTARWHDRGKAHKIFQAALPDGVPDPTKVWAKASKNGWKRYERRHFRHELASALSVLDPRNDKIPDEIRDLVAYLVAAHHGKVRLSIRSLPNERRPDDNRRFARGVWDDDELPTTELGGGVTAPAVTLSLEPMELGLCEQEPFRGLPSWAERMLRLRDTLGPFRLAYLEAILRAADMRASREAEQRDAKKTRAKVGAGGKGATP